MERMSINSYLRQGMNFDLFAYPEDQFAIAEDVGLTFYNANLIVPQDRLNWFPSPSIFSDYFRYALLRERGGFWVDMDTIALRPFDALDALPYLFASDNIDQFFVS